MWKYNYCLWKERSWKKSSYFVYKIILHLIAISISSLNISNKNTQLTQKRCFLTKHMFVTSLPQTSKRHDANKYVCRKPTWMFATSDNLPVISVHINTLGPWGFVGCHKMSENSGVGLYRFYCIYIYIYIYINIDNILNWNIVPPAVFISWYKQICL
jgi:hypothetical protein